MTSSRSRQTRRQQVRRAKRAQRARERAEGLRLVQLKLPRETAEKLGVAMRSRDFAQELDRLLDGLVVTIADYPALRDLAWNLAIDRLRAPDAFALYERNWRYVDEQRLTPAERDLIQRLAARYGSGIVHA